MLHSRKFEVIDKICNMHSINLKNTEFRVQTALGTSRRYYKHSIPSLIHDTSQSSGSSETHLVFISVPMTNTLEKKNNGCTIIGPDKKYKVKKQSSVLSTINDNMQMIGKATRYLYQLTNYKQQHIAGNTSFILLVINYNYQNENSIV